MRIAFDFLKTGEDVFILNVFFYMNSKDSHL